MIMWEVKHPSSALLTPSPCGGLISPPLPLSPTPLPYQSATTVALGHAHAGICEAMLTEVMMWVEEVLAEMEARKWKVR